MIITMQLRMDHKQRCDITRTLYAVHKTSECS
jgi:hypothetical protein